MSCFDGCVQFLPGAQPKRWTSRSAEDLAVVKRTSKERVHKTSKNGVPIRRYRSSEIKESEIPTMKHDAGSPWGSTTAAIVASLALITICYSAHSLHQIVGPKLDFSSLRQSELTFIVLTLVLSFVLLTLVLAPTRQHSGVKHADSAHGTEPVKARLGDDIANSDADGSEDQDSESEELETHSLLVPVANGFRQLIEGEDLKMEDFFQTSEAFLKVLQAMGPCMKLAQMDFSQNIVKAKKWYSQDQTLHRTLNEFLRTEKATGIHKPGAILDGSGGACAVLWMRRAFEYCAAVLGLLSEGASMSDAAKEGYKLTLDKCHGRMLQITFRTALNMVISREKFCQALSVEESSFNSQAKEFADSCKLLCVKMKTMQEHHDLEDTRRC